MFPFPLGFSGVKTVEDSAFITTSTEASTGLSWTHSSVSIGEPASNRYIIVSASTFSASGGFTSITVGGVSLDLAIEKKDSSYNQRVAAIFCGLVPSGTTADIVVTKTGSNATGSQISVFAAYGLSSSTPYVTLGVSASPSVLTSNVLANSFGVGVHCRYSGSSFDHTWVGLTENSDIGPLSNVLHTSASQVFTTTETPRTITVDNSGDFPASCFAAWQ